jgi:hypothetical protein
MCLVALAMVAYADTLGVDFAGGTTGNGGSQILGYEFDVLQPITIIGLAYYDENGDGLTEDHQVGVWDSSGALLAQATVGSSSVLIGFGSFRWTSLATPVNLSVADGYIVAGMTSSSENVAWDPPAYTEDGSINYVVARYEASPGFLTMPTETWTGGVGIFGGNIVVEDYDIPEPATLLLMGLGVGLVARRRLRAAHS